MILQPSDFVGFHTLAKTAKTEAIIQAYIDRYEVLYIRRLLGKTLGDLLIADIDGTTHVPNTAIYQALFNAFMIEHNTELKESTGMKDLLLSAVFYHYAVDSQNAHTPAGVVSQTVETSLVKSPENAYRFAEKKWNDMVPTWENIQWRAKTYAPSDYPTFLGQPISPSWSALL